LSRERVFAIAAVAGTAHLYNEAPQTVTKALAG